MLLIASFRGQGLADLLLLVGMLSQNPGQFAHLLTVPALAAIVKYPGLTFRWAHPCPCVRRGAAIKEGHALNVSIRATGDLE